MRVLPVRKVARTAPAVREHQLPADHTPSRDFGAAILWLDPVFLSLKEERLDHLRNAGQAFLSTLKKEDQAALVTSYNSVALAASLTSFQTVAPSGGSESCIHLPGYTGKTENYCSLL